MVLVYLECLFVFEFFEFFEFFCFDAEEAGEGGGDGFTTAEDDERVHQTRHAQKW